MDVYLQLAGLFVQTLLLLGGWFVMFGGMKAEIRGQGDHLKSIDKDIEELRKAVIALARQEERVAAIDGRLTLQGQRLDRTIQKVDGFLIYGRRKTTKNNEEDS